MVLCYDSNIVFSDPVFGVLNGAEAMDMWRMLLSRKDAKLNINFENVQSDNKSGTADWTAEYVFTKTGRPILNRVHATFEFQNGKIIKHADKFNLWAWSQQAFGWKGYVFGWMPFMKSAIRKMVRKSLEKHKANRNE